MKRLGLIVVAMLLLGGVYAAQTAPADPSGTYSCRGWQRGKDYAVTLTVKPFGETYEAAWFFVGEAAPAIVGLGLVDHNDLAITLVSKSGALGVALYRITPGKLEGVWSAGDGTLEPEVCRSGREA